MWSLYISGRCDSNQGVRDLSAFKARGMSRYLERETSLGRFRELLSTL